MRAKINSEYTREFVWKDSFLRWAGRVRKEDGVAREEVADPKNRPAPIH